MRGFFLCCVFLRARYSDAQGLQNLVIDAPAVASAGRLSGYFQGEASRTKTGHTLERKTALMAGPLYGVTGVPWFSAWLSLRSDLSIPAGPDLPLLPPQLANSTWSGVPASATVAAGWLRGILKSRGFGDLKAYGTHSCKATCLSWCAKWGVNPTERRVLGFHKAPQDEMMHVYGRDNVAPALRSLETVLADIRTGEFLPDQTDEAHEPSESEATLDEEDDLEDRKAVEQSLEEVAAPWAELPVDPSDAGQIYIRHRVSRKLHRLADESGAKLKCGRPCSVKYEHLVNRPRFMEDLCSACFKDASVP